MKWWLRSQTRSGHVWISNSYPAGLSWEICSECSIFQWVSWFWDSLSSQILRVPALSTGHSLRMQKKHSYGGAPCSLGLKKNQPATVKVTVNQGRAQSWCRGSLEVEWEWLGTWNSVPSLNKNKVGDEGDTKETGISVNRLIFKAHSESQIQGKILPVGADEAWYSVACLLIPALWESKAGDFRCRPSLDNLVI